MTCLCLSGGIIYLLPYLREVYYIPLQEALQLSNTQLGVLMSAFGVAAMISYFPGGWLADKISPRKLITISMLSTGMAGIYFATFEEGGIPLALPGTVTGIVSVIGYMPDIFMPLAGGALLDGYPGALGYRYFFIFIAGVCLLGLLAALIILRKFAKQED